MTMTEKNTDRDTDRQREQDESFILRLYLSRSKILQIQKEYYYPIILYLFSPT